MSKSFILTFFVMYVACDNKNSNNLYANNTETLDQDDDLNELNDNFVRKNKIPDPKSKFNKLYIEENNLRTETTKLLIKSNEMLYWINLNNNKSMQTQRYLISNNVGEKSLKENFNIIYDNYRKTKQDQSLILGEDENETLNELGKLLDEINQILKES